MINTNKIKQILQDNLEKKTTFLSIFEKKTSVNTYRQFYESNVKESAESLQ